MIIEGVKQVPHNTSLIGMIHGISDAYGMKLSTAEVFGGSGHAFLMNIHEQLCPSGPYVWDPAPFFKLSRNIGIDISDLGFFSAETSMDERGKIEADLRDYLSRGVLCGVMNMENQIIYGFDETGFLLSVPWRELPITPPHLAFGSWTEFGDELHINFFSIVQTEAAGFHESVRDSLEFAVEIHEHSRRYAQDHYGMGPEAYTNWLSAIDDGHGAGHGAWWNATVWSECRGQAADYLTLAGERIPDILKETKRASELYKAISENLAAASDKDMPKLEKRVHVEQAQDLESEAISLLGEIVEMM